MDTVQFSVSMAPEIAVELVEAFCHAYDYETNKVTAGEIVETPNEFANRMCRERYFADLIRGLRTTKAEAAAKAAAEAAATPIVITDPTRTAPEPE